MKNSHYLIVAILGILSLFSCSEDLMVNTDIETTETEARTQISPTPVPTVIGDRMKFEDFRHFKSYIRDLTDIYNANGEDFHHETQNKVVFPENLFSAFDQQQFRNPSDRFIPVVTDEAIQSVLNMNYEVQVDETLLTFFTNNQIIASDASDVTSKTALRALPKGESLTPTLLPTSTYAVDKDGLPSITTRSWCGCRVAVEQIDCNTVEIRGTCRNALWGDGGGTVSYDIVDDFSNVISSDDNIDVDGNFEFTIDISNLPNANFIFVDVDSDCAFNGSASVVLTPGATCDGNYRSTEWDWLELDGRAISYQTKYDNNLWGDYVQAKVYSYEWNQNSQRWVDDRAELIVAIDADIRGLECFVLNSESDSNDCNNCRNRKARKYIGVALNNFHFCTDDIIGSFEKIEGGVEIDTTQTIMFECCQ